MSDAPLDRRLCEELYELVRTALVGELSAAGAERLDHLLASDENARRLYVAYMQSNADIKAWSSGATSTEANEDIAPAEAMSLPTADEPRDEIQRTTMWWAIRDFASNYITLSLLIAAIVMANIVLSLGLITLDPRRLAPSIETPSTEFVAEITNTHNVEFDESSEGDLTFRSLFADDELVLNAGMVEITYFTGARVVLEGPASYKLQGDNSGYLDLGRLVARCDTPKSEGFIIATPTSLIEDLGTEFAVTVEQGGHTEVRVFEGSVSLSTSDDEQIVESLILHDNEVASIAPGDSSIERIASPGGNQHFLRPGDLAEQVSESYAERVLALRPAAYWRMEGREKPRVVDAIGLHHGKAVTRIAKHEPWSSGKFGSALRLGGPSSGECVIVADYPESTTNELTVAAWVLAESRSGWAMIATNWGNNKITGQFHLGLYANNGDLSANVTQTDGRWLLVREGPGQPFPTGRWQHVALVVDGKKIRIYRGGNEVANAEYDGTLITGAIAGMSIGCQLRDDGATPSGANWHGLIDELVIFNRALSVEEVESLAAANGP